MKGPKIQKTGYSVWGKGGKQEAKMSKLIVEVVKRNPPRTMGLVKQLTVIQGRDEVETEVG